MTTVATEKSAVRRGVALLDKYVPKWFDKFKDQQFNLADETQCALGQVYGEYHDGLKTLAETAIAKKSGIKLQAGGTIELDPFHYGFNTGGNNSSFERMGQQWLRAAARRRKRSSK